MAIKFFNAGQYEPKIGTSGSAGIDLYANSVDDSNGSWIIGTGIHVDIPQGWVGLLIPRSSWGSEGWSLCNTIGVIDSDYRGNVRILVFNLSENNVTITQGDRIAQLVLEKICFADVVEVDDNIGETKRGDSGFGSTGMR